MHNAIITKEDARLILQAQTGRSFPTAELVTLHTDDLVDMIGVYREEYAYFGDLVVQSYLPFGSSVILQNVKATSANKDTFTIASGTGVDPKGSINKNVIFDSVGSFDFTEANFYGWKFTLAQDFVGQSYTLTDGANWNLTGGLWTHTPGATTEQIYLGAWTVSSLLRVTITVQGRTAGSLQMEMDSSGNFGSAIQTDGTYTFTVNTTALDGALFLVPSSDFDGAYDPDSVIIEKLQYI